MQHMEKDLMNSGGCLIRYLIVTICYHSFLNKNDLISSCQYLLERDNSTMEVTLVEANFQIRRQ